MQTSVIGRPTSGGFTLLELLVVLSLMGLLFAAGASLYAGNGQRQAMRQAIAVETFLKDARRGALLSGKAYQVNVMHAGLSIEGTDVILNRSAIKSLRLLPGTQEKIRNDAIVFYPDGSSSAGLLEMKINGEIVRVNVDLLGRVHVEN